MAKKRAAGLSLEFIDRTLIVGIILMAVAYIMYGTWTGVFAQAGAFVVGVMWSYRAITTHPSKVFRLLATLVFVLATILLSFYLAASQGLA
jgi:hypothetical protein